MPQLFRTQTDHVLSSERFHVNYEGLCAFVIAYYYFFISLLINLAQFNVYLQGSLRLCVNFAKLFVSTTALGCSFHVTLEKTNIYIGQIICLLLTVSLIFR